MLLTPSQRHFAVKAKLLVSTMLLKIYRCIAKRGKSIEVPTRDRGLNLRYNQISHKGGLLGCKICTFQHFLQFNTNPFLADFRQEGPLDVRERSAPFCLPNGGSFYTFTRSSSTAGFILESSGKLKRLAKRIHRNMRSGSSRKVCRGSRGVRMRGEEDRRSTRP